MYHAFPTNSIAILLIYKKRRQLLLRHIDQPTGRELERRDDRQTDECRRHQQCVFRRRAERADRLPQRFVLRGDGLGALLAHQTRDRQRDLRQYFSIPHGRAAAAEEGFTAAPVSDSLSVTPVSASTGRTAWGSGVSSITGTPSAWAADTITRAEIYGITMLSDGSYQSPITRRTLARLAANTARTLGLVEDVSDPIAVVQQLGVMQPNADGSFDQTSRVTRQMAATVLLRLLRQSSTVFDADYSTLSRYPDSAAISDWAREAVAMMTQYELMNGTSKGFEPKKEMTLEQCLVLLTRICEF